ncbi:MAG: hypothetical protein U0900_22215 [Myxococcota bacterium]
MFRRLSEPLPLSEASILHFRPALNAPVLNVGYLPVGPARAAVVAFGEEYGGIGIALGVRASESRQVVVLRNQESIDFDVPLDQALEPLLEEAERMGFLFDEDLLEETPGQAGRARAMAHWADLMGGMESLLPPRSPDAERDRDDDDGPVGPLSPSQAVEEMQYPELMLDDVAPFVLDDEPASPLGLDATETLEPDLELEREATPEPIRADRIQAADLDEPLEHGLDEALADALEDGFDDGLANDLDDDLDGEDDWSLEDGVLGESDLTEPTAPIAAAPSRVAPPTPPAPPFAPVAASRPAPARAPESVARPVPPTAVAASPAPSPVVSMATRPAAEPPSASPGPTSDDATPTTGLPGTVAVSAKPGGGASPAAPRSEAPAEPKGAVVRPPRVVLSKFRNPDGLRGGARPGASEVGADRSSELARIPIVRVRRERDPAKRVPLLARLLSSF